MHILFPTHASHLVLISRPPALAFPRPTRALPSDGVEQLQFVKSMKLGRLLKNIRLLRVGRLLNFIVGQHSANKIQMQFANYSAIAWLFLFFLVVAHLTGCYFYFICDYDVSVSPPDTWIWSQGIHRFQDPTLWEMYVTSLYNAMLALLGDRLDTRRTIEKSMCIPIILIGAVLNATLFGQMALLISNINRSKNRFTERTNDCREQITSLGLDQKIWERVHDFLDFEW